MKFTRVKALLLVGVLIFQPMLSLVSSAEMDHDHSQHDHSAQQHHNVVAEHHARDSQDNHNHNHNHDHGHPELAKAMAGHDCGPCLNGDMSHCQCGAVVPPVGFAFSLPLLLRDTLSLYRNVLAAHSQSLIRPPIIA